MFWGRLAVRFCRRRVRIVWRPLSGGDICTVNTQGVLVWTPIPGCGPRKGLRMAFWKESLELWLQMNGSEVNVGCPDEGPVARWRTWVPKKRSSVQRPVDLGRVRIQEDGQPSEGEQACQGTRFGRRKGRWLAGQTGAPGPMPRAHSHLLPGLVLQSLLTFKEKATYLF